MKFKIMSKTDKGLVRDHNEDDYTVSPDVFSGIWEAKPGTIYDNEAPVVLVMCDGMGGLAAGEVASRLTCEFIEQNFAGQYRQKTDKRALLSELLIGANNYLLKYLQSHTEINEMGTTVVLALIVNNTCHIAWVGDSRAYIYRQNKLKPITKDHSPVQELVDAGTITEDEAFEHPRANYISQSIGQPNKPVPGYSSYPLYTGDKLFLCTDGVCGEIKNPEIAKCFSAPDEETILENIKQAVFATGAADNLSMTILTVLDNGLTAPEQDVENKEEVNKFETIAYNKSSSNKSISSDNGSLKTILTITIVILLLSTGVMAFFTKDIWMKWIKPDNTTIEIDSIPVSPSKKEIVPKKETQPRDTVPKKTSANLQNHVDRIVVKDTPAVRHPVVHTPAIAIHDSAKNNPPGLTPINNDSPPH